MPFYKNLSNHSGVLSYEIDYDSIIVQFRRGGAYLYNRRNPGAGHLESLKSLAISGIGLNTYINKHVKKSYDAKLR
jgi:hypothetical protein